MGHEEKTAKTFDSYLSIELLGGGTSLQIHTGVCAAKISATTHVRYTPSQNFEEVTKTIQHQRDKGSRAGSDNFVLSGHWNEVLI